MGIEFSQAFHMADRSVTAIPLCNVAEWVLCHEYRRSTRRHATVQEMKEGPSYPSGGGRLAEWIER